MSTQISEKFKLIREAENLTQKQLSEMIGCSISGLKNYEGGRRSPNLETIMTFCQKFPKYTMYLMHDTMPEPRVDGQITPQEKMNEDLNSQAKHA